MSVPKRDVFLSITRSINTVDSFVYGWSRHPPLPPLPRTFRSDERTDAETSCDSKIRGAYAGERVVKRWPLYTARVSGLRQYRG